MKQVEFTISGDVIREMAPNRKRHWAEQARLTKHWRLIAWMAWKEAGGVPLRGKVCLQFTIHKGHLGRPPDNDAGLSSLKAVIDGLVRGPTDDRRWETMLPDDGPRYVEYAPVVIERSKEWVNNPHVIVRVTPMEEQNG